MYKSFRVKNFRCFKDLQINDLGRVNLIAGKNNTGKTALMEAMYLHTGNRDPLTILRSSVSYAYSSARSIQQDFPEPMNFKSWDVVFYNFCAKEDIELKAKLLQCNSISSEPNQTSQLTLSVPTREEEIDKILRNFHISGDYIFEILQFKTDSNNKPFHLLLTDKQVIPSRLANQMMPISEFLPAGKTVKAETDNTRFSNLRQSGKIDVLVDTLNQIDHRVTKLEILQSGDSPRIHADIGLDHLIPLAFVGDGMNRVTSLILAMTAVPGEVIFIDEIENGIHYSVQKDVWKAIGQAARELDIQVFATTHSLEIIRAAYEAFKDDDPHEFRYHRLDRDSHTGDIRAVTYNEFGMEAVAAFDFEHEVRG